MQNTMYNRPKTLLVFLNITYKFEIVNCYSVEMKWLVLFV